MMSVVMEFKKGTLGMVTKQQYNFVQKGQNSRFCSDLTQFSKHVSSIVTHKHAVKCAVCSINAYKKCSICCVLLHFNKLHGQATGKQCFIHYHNHNHFGLCFSDRQFVGVGKDEWVAPTDKDKQLNKRLIQSYKKK